MNVNSLITAALSAPKTHEVVTTYADGRVRTFQTRSEATARNHADTAALKAGRSYVQRGTGNVVRVESVVVRPIKRA